MKNLVTTILPQTTLITLYLMMTEKQKKWINMFRMLRLVGSIKEKLHKVTILMRLKVILNLKKSMKPQNKWLPIDSVILSNLIPRNWLTIKCQLRMKLDVLWLDIDSIWLRSFTVKMVATAYANGRKSTCAK